MTGPLAYHNGQLVPMQAAVLACHDAGIVSGATVTDFCRTFGQQLYLWPAHLARFRHDCATCFIDLEQTDAELTAAASALIAHNARLLPSGSELALITFATPGPLGLYAGVPGQNGPPTVVMHTFALPLPRYAPFFRAGVCLAIAGHHTAAADDLAPPAIKHRSRLHWWRAEHLLRQRRDVPAGTLPVLLDAPGGALTETAMGHVLLVCGDTVLAPPRGTVLEGISLGVVRELCTDLGIAFAEHRLGRSEVANAQEAMLTGSAFCLAGVRQIEERCFAWPGPVTQTLLRAWSERVGVDIARQFLG